MSEAKIKVPDFIRKAAKDASDGLPANHPKRSDYIAEAICRAISEHPIVPTEEQATILRRVYVGDSGSIENGMASVAIKWQRICFAAPEPEVPEEIEDLMWSECVQGYEDHNGDVIAAWCRAKDSKAAGQ